MTRLAGRGGSTSWLDRTWLNHWIALALSPIHAPDVAALREDMLRLMAIDPTHPLCCVLDEYGRRWRPVAVEDRLAHVGKLFVAGGAMPHDHPLPYVKSHRPDPRSRLPFKVVVGPDSLALYFAHVAGDATVLVPFSALLSLGNVMGLQTLRCAAGAPVAMRLLLSQLLPHGREWWRHRQTNRQRGPAAPSSGAAVGAACEVVTDGAATMLTAAQSADFTSWRKRFHPDLSAAGLMASATYRALTAEGIPVRGDAFYTLIDLRRHLPDEQARRPGNLAKSVYVPAALNDPGDVAVALSQAVNSARGVAALTSGMMAANLAPRFRSAADPRPSGTTLTFNSIMRNPGAELVPWTNPADARYLMMSYPVAPQAISVAACGVPGRLLFSASFDSDVLDGAAVQRSLERLRDIPRLLAPRVTYRRCMTTRSR